MAYKIKATQIAYVRITDEPVLVKAVSDDGYTVQRVVDFKGNSPVYGEGFFSLGELYTDRDRLVKELDFLKFEVGMRDSYSQEYQESKRPKQSAVPVAQADGNSYLN